MPAETAWGLDIGESNIKALKLARVRDFVEIIDVDVLPLQSRTSQEEESGADRQVRLMNTLEEFVRIHNPADSTVVVSLPGRITLSKLVTLPPVEEKRLPELVRYEVQQQIPFPIDEIVWDYYRCGGEYMPGQEVEVNLVAIRKEIVEGFASNFEQVGIPVGILQSAPIALFNLAGYELSPDGNVVIIDVGAENTYLVIIDRGRFWLRTLGIAGRNITQALAEKFEIPFDEAEMLKINASKSKHSAKIFAVIRPVLRELVGEIHRTIGFYKSMSKDVTFDRVFFLGNSTKLAGFEKFFGENLPYKIQMVRGLANIRVSRAINLKALQEHLPGLGVALGLGLQGLGDGRCKVNLLPEAYNKTLSPGKTAMLVGSVFFLLFGLLVSYLSSVWAADATAEKAQIYAGGEEAVSIGKIDNWQTKAARLQKDEKRESTETRTEYLVHFMSLDQPVKILNTIQSALKRTENPKRSETDKTGIDVYAWDQSDEITLIKVQIRAKEVIPDKKPRTSRRSRRTTTVTPEAVSYIEIRIAGIVRMQGDTAKTKKYIMEGIEGKEDAFVEILKNSKLTAKGLKGSEGEEIKPVEYLEGKSYRTSNFNTRGFEFPAPDSKDDEDIKIEDDAKGTENENGDFLVFLIKWNVDPSRLLDQNNNP